MPEIARTENAGKDTTPVSLGFGDLYASPGDHIGHFYQTSAEWTEILIPFLCEGLKADSSLPVRIISDSPHFAKICCMCLPYCLGGVSLGSMISTVPLAIALW